MAESLEFHDMERPEVSGPACLLPLRRIKLASKSKQNVVRLRVLRWSKTCEVVVPAQILTA